MLTTAGRRDGDSKDRSTNQYCKGLERVRGQVFAIFSSKDSAKGWEKMEESIPAGLRSRRMKKKNKETKRIKMKKIIKKNKTEIENKSLIGGFILPCPLAPQGPVKSLHGSLEI